MESRTTFAQFLKAKTGFEYLGYLIGGEVNREASSAIYGLTKNKDEFKKIGDINTARSGHVALVLPQSISDKCGV